MTDEKINKIYVVVAKENGQKGIAAWRHSSEWMPLVWSNTSSVSGMLKKTAQALSTEIDQELTLLEFSVRGEIQVFRPEKK